MHEQTCAVYTPFLLIIKPVNRGDSAAVAMLSLL